MTRPLFLSRGGLISTHRPATPKPTPKPKGSIDPAYIAAGTLILLAGAGSEGVLSAIEGRWLPAGACVLSFGLTVAFYGLASRMSVRKRRQGERRERELQAARIIQDAEARRQSIKAQLGSMHENDSRRGRLQQQLERNMLVVLSGGRA